RAVVREAFDTLLGVLAPFAPHIAEEMWSRLGNKETIDHTPWPRVIPELLRTEEMLIVIQVNGKVRQKITVPAEIGEEDLKAQCLADPKIQSFLGDREVKKVISVPRKLVNI
ncbi:MAG: class I tRNA ligase family protein, partial [Nitrospinaceae bacterium]|nr:class I tRNA ligase family protein [Nitrospinaceae bacterium]NIS85458.1 class I tRNA ligase family protein [Nitrospinaceae bacterium]NIT82292.1 class I tRNA ligase family protein [Nitrospinaceae bacterium]NIU96662.1 class I tRNA ligase family protein [Nitrospinaceae bacterium]NIY15511.1 class I tRNA ligase family protein [Nitrospinaceae bacterium]